MTDNFKMLISQIQRFPLLLLKIVTDLAMQNLLTFFNKNKNITIDNLVFRFQKVTF